MDEETANLILRLQREDVEQLAHYNHFAGGQDAALAASILRENLAEVETALADRRMTTSIAAAVRADATLLAESVEEGDRPTILVDEATVARLAPLNDVPIYRPLSIQSCTACFTQERSDHGANVACGHFYCRECISELFKASFNDESLFPPRCCRQTIKINEEVGDLLSQEIKDQYPEKAEEFGTTDRVYCSNTGCGIFIKPRLIIDGVAECSTCQSKTCASCREAQHEGDCPQDTALQAALEVARENGWQRCFQCKTMVELSMGCHHMVSGCKHSENVILIYANLPMSSRVLLCLWSEVEGLCLRGLQ